MNTCEPGKQHLQQLQRQANLDLVRHIGQHEPCNFEDLFYLFGVNAKPSPQTRQRFQSRLSYLVNRGTLRLVIHLRQRHWCVPQQVATAAEPTEPPEPDAPDEVWVGSVAPSPRNDVMHCGYYVPEPEPTLRAGSLDYKRYASVGDRC